MCVHTRKQLRNSRDETTTTTTTTTEVMEGSAKPIKDKPEMRFRSKTMERQFNGVDVEERRDPFDDAKPVAESPHGPADEALKEVSVKKRASLFGGGSAPHLLQSTNYPAPV